MYITTSRKPSQKTRRLAKFLSKVFLSIYENRGKKSISEVVARADSLGEKRVMIVKEHHGNPSVLSFISIGPRAEEWGWLDPEIRITVEEIPDPPEIDAEGVMLEGKDKEKYQHLFGFEKPDTDLLVEVIIEGKEIKIKYNKKSFKMKILGNM